MSGLILETVAWLYDLGAGSTRDKVFKDEPTTHEKATYIRNGGSVEPLVRGSSLAKALNEVERLRAEVVRTETAIGEMIDAGKAEWSRHGSIEIALGQWKSRAEAAEGKAKTAEKLLRPFANIASKIPGGMHDYTAVKITAREPLGRTDSALVMIADGVEVGDFHRANAFLSGIRNGVL